MSGSGVILSVGMSTPLGLDARQSSLVLRARKMAPTKTAFRDRHGFAIGDVRARRLDDALVGPGRLLALAAPALREALSGVPPTEAPLFLAVPERRSEAEAPLGPTFLSDLADRAGAGAGAGAGAAAGVGAGTSTGAGASTGVRIALDRSEAIAIGHAGFAVALSRAIASVNERAAAILARRSGSARGAPAPGHREPVAIAIAGGVDSHHDPAVLAALDEERRLHGSGTRDGFIPSEGAAFVVVTAHETRLSYARVTGVATGMEREDGAEDPPIGEAATEVTRAAAGALAEPIPWVICDVNGEHHRVKEWTFVRIRNRALFDDDHTVETRPYDELGDVGAASGAVFAVHACVAFRMGFAPAQRALVALRSEGGARGAFLLEAR